MATFYLPENQRALIGNLFGAEKPFSTMYDVAIFAAMVAIDSDRFDPLESDERGQEIADRIFIQNDRHGLIYMLALAHENSSVVLSDERGDDIWRIFEGYAKAGLGIIEGWLQDNPVDVGDKILIAKITEKAKLINKKTAAAQPVEIDF